VTGTISKKCPPGHLCSDQASPDGHLRMCLHRDLPNLVAIVTLNTELSWWGLGVGGQ
jgi:hypothetical protein